MVQTGPRGIEAVAGVDGVLSKANEEVAAHCPYREAAPGVPAGHDSCHSNNSATQRFDWSRSVTLKEMCEIPA